MALTADEHTHFAPLIMQLTKKFEQPMNHRRHGKSTARIVLYLAMAMAVAVVAWAVVRWAITPRVTVTTPITGPVVQAFYATGTVRPDREFPIKSNTAGTVDKVLVDKGDRVRAGQTLAVITDPSLVFAVARARAELDEKQARLDEKNSPVLIEYDQQIAINVQRMAIAQREVDRMQRLGESAAASSVDSDRAVDRLRGLEAEAATLVKGRATKLLELKRELAVARAAADIAAWELEQTTLKAPVDGVVLDRPTSLGTRVAVNDVLMRIADVRPANLVMRAAVDEEDVTHAEVGQAVRMSLYAFPGQRVSGRVSRIYDEADKDRRTFEVDVTFDSPDAKLSAGMTGELAFITAEKQQATIVPATALQNGVVMVVRHGRLAKSDATVGVKGFDRIEVTGLAENDRVVISPVGTLSPGQSVRVSEIDPAEATGLNKEKTPINQEAASMKAF